MRESVRSKLSRLAELNNWLRWQDIVIKYVLRAESRKRLPVFKHRPQSHKTTGPFIKHDEKSSEAMLGGCCG